MIDGFIFVYQGHPSHVLLPSLGVEYRARGQDRTGQDRTGIEYKARRVILDLEDQLSHIVRQHAWMLFLYTACSCI